MLSELSQQATAQLLGMNAGSLREWSPLARLDSGLYDGPAVVAEFLAAEIAAAREKWEKESPVAKDAKDRWELARARKAEIEADLLVGSTVESQTVTNEFMAMAAAVRSELESLPKSMENDFPADLRESLMVELVGKCKQILRRLANRGEKYK